MGAWSTDILGSDDALDTLGKLCELIHFDKEVGLYPLPIPTDYDKIAAIKLCLLGSEKKIFKTAWRDEEWPVIATIYLATGAKMPLRLMTKAMHFAQKEINKIDQYDWDNPRERIEVLRDYITLLDWHEEGKITCIEHTGLFEKIAPKIGLDISLKGESYTLYYTKSDIDSQESFDSWESLINRLRFAFNQPEVKSVKITR